jgi:hypothetical protein
MSDSLTATARSLLDGLATRPPEETRLLETT